MAGIGFQLRKIIGKGGIGGTVGALVSGIFIVAGPWLISVLSMVILQAAFTRSTFAEVPIFQSTIVYCYAFSLSLFAGIHHHFTRIVADLAWEQKYGESTTWMLRFVGLVVLVSFVIAVPVAILIPLNIQGDMLFYRISLVVLFIAINIAWIVMLFISLLRDYRVISLVFGTGMAISIAGTLILSDLRGAGGAVFGYAIGILMIDAAFIAIAVTGYPPRRPADGWSAFGLYARKYSALIVSGFFFYAGQWLDKFYFWVVRGTVVQGSILRVYESYDFAVYLAGLSIIPGLVYFIIISETQLFTDLKHFLFSLNHSSWTRIQKAKQRVIQSLRQELKDQSLLQISFSLLFAFILLLFGPKKIAGLEMWLAMGASFTQFTLLTILVFLYYFELYNKALLVAGAYFMMNGAGGILLYGFLPWMPAGAGHLLAGTMACIAGYVTLRQSVYQMDRIIFRRALGV